MKRMGRVGISVIALSIVIGLAFAGSYWWANTVPLRPSGVTLNAVFLWAPYVGLPGPRHGIWLGCWTDQGGTTDLCRLTNQDGSVMYEGVFVSLSKIAVRQGQLEIDGDKSRENRVWVGDVLVPLVHLKSGGVLLPLDRFEESVRLLNGQRP